MLRLLHADVRQNLADCLYCYAAQSGLPTQATVKYVHNVTVLFLNDVESFSYIGAWMELYRLERIGNNHIIALLSLRL